MSLPGSSPRWQAFEARYRAPPVRPSFQVIPTVHKPDKVAICERFCAKRHHFLEIRLIRARLHIHALEHPQPDPHRWTAKEIIRLVAEKHDLTPHDLTCDGRIAPLVMARHEAMYDIARLTNLSLMQIGKAFGRDHTTARAGIIRHVERTGAPPVRGLVFKPRSERIPRDVPKYWTKARAEEVKELRRQGLMFKEIGKALGIGARAASYAVTRFVPKPSKSTPSG